MSLNYLQRGHKVQVLDAQWFGNFCPAHPNLTVTKGDVRDIDSINLQVFDTVIHLSSVANDPCGDLDPKLTWEISALATMQLADKAVRQGVKQFILRFFWQCLRHQGRRSGHRRS